MIVVSYGFSGVLVWFLSSCVVCVGGDDRQASLMMAWSVIRAQYETIDFIA